MKFISRWTRLWRQFRQRAALEDDLNAELQFHLESRRDDLIKLGLSNLAATRQARIELGMLEIHKDNVRAALGLAWPDQIGIYWRTSLASLRRHRGLAAGSVLILGMAVAINVALYAIFTTYQSAAPEAIRRGELVELALLQSHGRRAAALSDAELASVAANLKEAAAAVIVSKPIRMQPNAELGVRMNTSYGVAANAAYFADLAAPMMGRKLAAFDDSANAAPVIVLSFEGWQQLLGGRADALGQSIAFGATRFTVIGVMPKDLVDFQPFPPHFWISNSGYARWRTHFLGSDKTFGNDIGLISLADPAKASASLLAELNRLPSRQGDESLARVDFNLRKSLFSSADQQDVQLAAWPVFALVILVLAVACANLANLMLAKALGQQQELAIRASIGASRARLVLQLCCDSTFIAILAACVGWILGHIFANPIHQYLLSTIAETGLQPIKIEISFSSWLFAFALCWLGTLVFGLLPALSATSKALHLQAKRDGAAFGRQFAPSNVRGALTVMQIAASFLLLVLAFSVSMLASQYQSQDLGFSTEHLIDLRHQQPSTQLRQRIEALPGVLRTSAVRTTPLYGPQPRVDTIIDSKNVSVGVNAIDERYLATMGMQLMQGRNFYRTEAEFCSATVSQANTCQTPVALISLAMANSLWPKMNALGRRIEIVDGDNKHRSVTVVGVVSDVASGLIFQGKDSTMMYLPTSLAPTLTAQNLPSDTPRELLISVIASQRVRIIQQLRELCLKESIGQSCDPWSLTQLLDRQQLVFVIARNAATVLALSALCITLVGLFSVVRFNVANRTHEIGVRLAIGACHGHMIAMLLRELWAQVRLGMLIALPISLLASYAIHRGFGLSTRDLLICYSLSIVGLACAAGIAAWWPARAVRAISPKSALA